MDHIRIGIIGAGAVARDRHIPRLKAIQGVELSMVWNRTVSKAQGIAREFGFSQAVADWREIAESTDIDAVVVATPPGTHHEMTLASLAGGKHVLCQARMSRNLKEAKEMRDAAANAGRVTCLYPPLPGLKGDRTMLRLLEGDYIGELREVHVVGMAAPAARDSYDWRRDPDVTGLHLLTMGMWIEVLNRWVGPATSLAARAGYHFDKVMSSAGEMVDATVPDSVAITANLESGAAASYHFSTEASFAGPHKIELYGSRGVLIYTLFGDEIHGATEGMTSLQRIEPDPDEIRLQTTDAEFISAIREGTPVHPSFEEGVRYMEFCEAVGQSVQFDRVVELPPEPLMTTWGRTL